MKRATTTEIINSQPYPLPLSPKFKDFLGNVPRNKQFNISITGEPGSAKSSFCFMLANEFSRSGKVLYCAAEENLDSGAIRQRILSLRISKQNIVFIHPDSYSDITDELSAHNYQFCFIDSINEVYTPEGEQMLAKDVIRIAAAYPNTSFVFISQINALGNRAAGGQKATHKADIKIFCKRDKKTDERLAYLTGNRFYPKVNEFTIFPAMYRPSINEVLRKNQNARRA